MGNTLTRYGYIDTYTVFGWTDNAEEKYRNFLTGNRGKHIEVTFVIADGPEYYMHKYYRGYVLPYIAEAQGEKDIDYVHHMLKAQFLLREVSDIHEIPSRHRARCMVIMRDKDVVGYIPSTATLTYEEMKEFILKCEEIRDGLHDWHIDNVDEAVRLRRLAFDCV